MTGEPSDAGVAWHISTHSQNADANCVEAGPVLDGSGRVAVRDSTRRRAGTLTLGDTAWRTFARWAARIR